MVYDVRQDVDTGTLRSRTGQVMQSRVKSAQTLKELSYIIKNFSLVIKEQRGCLPTSILHYPRKERFLLCSVQAGRDRAPFYVPLEQEREEQESVSP